MKCCGAYDSVEGTLKWKIEQVSRDQTHSRSILRQQMLPRRLQHVLGKIDAYHSSVR